MLVLFTVINIEWTIKFSQTQLMHVWERGELVGFPTGATPPTAVQCILQQCRKSANANIREHSSLDQAYS